VKADWDGKMKTRIIIITLLFCGLLWGAAALPTKGDWDWWPTLSAWLLTNHNADGTHTFTETNIINVYNVVAYGAAGDGATDDETDIESAITAAASAGGVVYFPTGSYKFLTAITVPVNVTLLFDTGATILGDGTSILTFTGAPENITYTNQQIFESTMSVVFTNGGTVYPEWWGIDGTADEVQINLALDSLPALDGSRPFGGSHGGICKITNEYTIAAPVLLHEGQTLEGVDKFESIIYNSAAATNAIEVYSVVAPSVSWYANIRHLQIRGNAASGYGLHILHCEYSVFEDLLITTHGDSGIYVLGLSVGQVFINVQSYDNVGWGLQNGDTALGALATTSTTQRYDNCQFRGNTLGGASIFRCTNVTMNQCVYESNSGPGLEIEGWHNVINDAYFENNHGGAHNITGATQANPCVLTFSAGHDYQNGQSIVIYGVVGMTELNGNTYTVANEDATTLELSGINSGAYGVYVADAGDFATTFDITLNTSLTTCYGNIIRDAQIESGVIHLNGGDNNQIIGAKLSNANPNILIEATSSTNQIIDTRRFNSINLTDGGGANKQMDSLIFDSATFTADNSFVVGSTTIANASATFSGLINVSDAIQALSGPGEINATTAVTEFTSTGGGDALTIANGTSQGQLKIIQHVVDGGSGVLTDAVLAGTSVTFTDDGESCTLMWSTAQTKWFIVGTNAVFAP